MCHWTSEQQEAVWSAAQEWVSKYRGASLDDKEDAVGDVVEALLRRMTSLPVDPVGLGKFVCTACNRAVMEIYRKRLGRGKRGRSLCASQIGPADSDSGAMALDRRRVEKPVGYLYDLRSDLRVGVSQLRLKPMRVVLEALIINPDRVEVAKQCGVAVGTVNSYVSRAGKFWRANDSFMRLNGYGKPIEEEKRNEQI